MGVVTVTFRLPNVAVAVTEKVALMVVAFTTVKELTVTPVLATVTAVAPVRLVPVRTTATFSVAKPRVAEGGAIEVKAGPWTASVTVFVVPFGVVMLRETGPSVAVLVRVQFAVTVVLVDVPVIAQLTPVTPVPALIAVGNEVPATKSMPVNVTGTTVPRTPVVGLIEVSDGPRTMNVAVEVTVFPLATIVTVRALRAADEEITNVAETLVLVAVNVLTVTPVPETATDVAPARFVPVIVTTTEVPR